MGKVFKGENRGRPRLKRVIQTMPSWVRKALMEHKLMEAYRARPPYQRNDYLDWIKRAARDETKAKRLNQMLRELRRGDRYMNMIWRSQTK